MENKNMEHLRRIVNKYNLKDITGAKVKIDVDKIRNRNINLSEKYKEFLLDSEDKIFTARLDIDNCYTTMYTLDEDITPIKWLFHIEDLILID